MLQHVQTKLYNCCCCCHSKQEPEEEKLFIEQRETLPIKLSTENVNGQKTTLSCKGSSSKEVPFTIPKRKLTPILKCSDESEEYEKVVSALKEEHLKAELGQLDVTMYAGYDSDDATTYPQNHLGRLWYTIHYDKTEEQLNVTIIKAKNLPKKRDDNFYDCAIRVTLLPGEKRYRQTSRKEEQADPIFEEIFKFPLAATSVTEKRTSVYFTLYQSTHSSKRLEITGHAMIQVDETVLQECIKTDKKQKCFVDFVSRKTTIQEMQVVRFHKGKILLSLKLDKTGVKPRLFVTVYKCIQLMHEQISDVVLKLEMMIENKREKKKRGHVVRLVCSETDFNEIFKFSVVEDKLPETSISIQIKTVRPMTDKTPGNYGRTVVGGVMLAAGRELEHWRLMIDKPGEDHIQWHDLC